MTLVAGFTLRTEVHGDTITQDLHSHVGEVYERIYHKVLVTSEQQVRDKLVELGWTPPGCTTREYDELREIIDGGSESMTHADAVDALHRLIK